MTDTPFILRSDKGGVTALTLNRPETRNALSLGMLLALSAELRRAATDPSVRVVVLTGAGPAFCAGHDLKEIRAENFGSAYTEALFASGVGPIGDVAQQRGGVLTSTTARFD